MTYENDPTVVAQDPVQQALASFTNLLEALDQGEVRVTPQLHRVLVEQLAVIRAAVAVES